MFVSLTKNFCVSFAQSPNGCIPVRHGTFVFVPFFLFLRAVCSGFSISRGWNHYFLSVFSTVILDGLSHCIISNHCLFIL